MQITFPQLLEALAAFCPGRGSLPTDWGAEYNKQRMSPLQGKPISEGGLVLASRRCRTKSP